MHVSDMIGYDLIVVDIFLYKWYSMIGSDFIRLQVIILCLYIVWYDLNAYDHEW